MATATDYFCLSAGTSRANKVGNVWSNFLADEMEVGSAFTRMEVVIVLDFFYLYLL